MDSTSTELSLGSILKNGLQTYQLLGAIKKGSSWILYKATNDEGGFFIVKELFIGDSCFREGNEIDISVPFEDKIDFEAYKNNLIRETIVLAKNEHPNIIRSVDSFKENNTSYAVYEWIDGISLDEYRNKKGTLTDTEIYEIIDSITNTLKHLHQSEIPIIHKNIKPENIMISGDEIILVGFGNAKNYNINPKYSLDNSTKGYEPIELFSEEEKVGTYTDLFSLGAILYYLLVGRNPLPVTDRMMMQKGRKDMDEIEYQLMESNVKPVWKNVVHKLLEFNPQDRFQNADELIVDLNKIKHFITNDFVKFEEEDFSELVKEEEIEPDKIEEKKERIETQIGEIENEEESSNKKWLLLLLPLIAFAIFYFSKNNEEDNSNEIVQEETDIENEEPEIIKIETLFNIEEIKDEIKKYYAAVDNKDEGKVKGFLAPFLNRYYDKNDMTRAAAMASYQKYNKTISSPKNEVLWETLKINGKDEAGQELNFTLNYSFKNKNNKIQKYKDDIIIIRNEDGLFTSIYSLGLEKIE